MAMIGLVGVRTRDEKMRDEDDRESLTAIIS